MSGEGEHTMARGMSSLAMRAALLFSALIGGVVLLGGWFLYSGNRASVLHERERELDHRAGLIMVRIQSEVAAVANDVRALAKMPAIQNLAAAATPSQQTERARSEAIGNFAALLEGKPTYAQTRLLSLKGEGMEVIRLDNREGTIVPTAPSDLQPKGHRDYFRESLGLQPGEVYLSDINLNQEYGEVSLPHMPTLRAASKTYHPDGADNGLMVINVDLRPLFAELRTMAGARKSLYLANQDGDYLVHPDSTQTFGFDLGERHLVQDDFGSDLSAPVGKEGELVRFRRFPLHPGSPTELIVGVGMPRAQALAELEAVRNRGISATLGAALIAVAVVWLLTLLLSRRLSRVAESIEQYEPGSGQTPALPEQGRDEVAIVARKFSAMAGKIEDQIIALEEARSNAEENRRAKESFLAHLSHEIRTPMNAVTGMIHTLARDRPSPHQEKMLKTLEFSSRQLIAVVNDVLDYSKIEAGKMKPELESFDLRELLQNLCESQQTLAAERGVDLTLELDPELPDWVNGDPLRLFQILGNLLQNALRFTGADGQVILAVQPEARSGASVPVRFAVRDTGVGMSKEDLQRALTPFEQAAATPRGPRSGSGLGLPIAQALVSLLGGELELASKLGQGTTASFTVPFLLSKPPARDINGTKDFLTGHSILCVEDVESNQRVLAAMLKPYGANLEFADTAAAALDFLENSEQPSLALVDLQLPDRDGASLAEEVTRRWPTLPMIGLTAQTSGELLDRAKEAGIQNFVWKPIDPTKLVTTLRAQTEPPSTLSLDHVRQIFDNNGDRIRQFLDTLITEWERALGSLPGLCRDTNREGIDALHHRMQNSLASVQAETLGKELQKLARAAREGQPLDPSPCSKTLEAALQDLKRLRDTV